MASTDTTFDGAISRFPPEIRDDLRAALATGGVIPSERACAWLDRLDIETGHLMIRLLPVAASYARVPISGFQVGAVSLGMPSGSLYLGSNMEFPGQPLSFCVHGEQSAVNNAWLHGETGVQALAIGAAPCGYCRQFLYELTTATKGLHIFLKADKDPNGYAYTSHPLTYYLPDAFGPEDLHIEGGLMEPEAHGLTILGGDPLARAALAAANASYSPYTKDYCGVALKGPDGRIHTGRYAENAAYNPSMSPMESALAGMSMSLSPGADLEISAAVLVEAQADISQKDATEDVLSSVAPGVTLEYFQASVG